MVDRTEADLLRSLARRVKALEARRTVRTGRVGSSRVFYPSGGRYIRVGSVSASGASGGAHIIADFYGGSGYGFTTRNSGRLHFAQRGVGASGIRLDVWNFGATTVSWFSRYLSDFNFELWVQLPTFASTISVRPGDVAAGRLLFDSETTSAPSGLVAANNVVNL